MTLAGLVQAKVPTEHGRPGPLHEDQGLTSSPMLGETVTRRLENMYLVAGSKSRARGLPFTSPRAPTLPIMLIHANHHTPLEDSLPHRIAGPTTESD